MPASKPRQRLGWFAGLTWKGVSLVALLCLFNALRRNADFEEAASLAAWLSGVVQAFGTSLIVMLLTALAIVAAYNRAPAAPRWRYPALALAVLGSSAVGTAILGAMESRTLEYFAREYGSLARWVLGTWPRYAVLGLLIASVFVYFRGAEESEAAARRAELDRALLEQQMDEARLQVLQAQIEPHFLFNTLAHVRRLYQTDRTAAESMLENLMHYLAVSLPQMRAGA